MKNPFEIATGTVVSGKWHKNSYRIIKRLGHGANGTVFLADSKGKKVALKMSREARIITSETNVLKSFAKAQGKRPLGPSLFDVDDWEHQGQVIPFYVMEYIEGDTLFHFLERRGRTWLPVLILQLLEDLAALHKMGWVFGDLKPENMIVTPPPHRIRCIDVGGATKISRAIKEYTEFFDRGYWGMGTRKAEPSYDLFAVAMVIINCYYPGRFQKKEGGLNQLNHMIRKHLELKKYAEILNKAITGKYQRATEMRHDVLLFIQNKAFLANKSSYNRYQTQKKIRSKKRKQIWSVLETIFILTVIGFLYFAYFLEKMM